jgi:hypothetical protein
MRGYVVESLMARGYDEPFSLYGVTRICAYACSILLRVAQEEVQNSEL